MMNLWKFLSAATIGAFIWMSFCSSALACVLVNSAGPGMIEYDPTEEIAKTQLFDVIIQNTCETNGSLSPRSIELWFEDDIEPAPFAKVGGVPFSLQRLNREVLETPIRPLSSPIRLDLSEAQRAVQIEAILTPERRAQTGVRQVSLKWRSADAFGAVFEETLDVLIGIRASSGLGLALNGGVFSETLNFDELEPGERMSTNVIAKAGQPYTISLSSTYGDKLRRVETCGMPLDPTSDPAETIQYTARLDGRRVRQGRSFSQNRSSRAQIARTVHDLTIEIDPNLRPDRKRAGRYCDILTLSIQPRN